MRYTAWDAPSLCLSIAVAILQSHNSLLSFMAAVSLSLPCELPLSSLFCRASNTSTWLINVPTSPILTCHTPTPSTWLGGESVSWQYRVRPPGGEAVPHRSQAARPSPTHPRVRPLRLRWRDDCVLTRQLNAQVHRGLRTEGTLPLPFTAQWDSMTHIILWKRILNFNAMTPCHMICVLNNSQRNTNITT